MKMKYNKPIINIFEIKEELVTNYEEEAKKEYKKIINNYKKVIDETVKIIKYDLGIIELKSYLIYRIGFLVELFLKYVLYKNNCLNMDELKNIGHNIPLLFNKVKESNIDEITKNTCTSIKNTLSKYKDGDNQCINFCHYVHYRYNYNNVILINENTLSSIEKNRSKEITECIARTIEKE